MRRWMAAPVVFIASVALIGDSPLPRAVAQPPAPVAETFLTADGVKLHGLFHASPKAIQGEPVVVLMYGPGPDRTMTKPGDWDGLAKRLNDEGFHVFRFDWRGHGKSDTITDTKLFWQTGYTAGLNLQYIKGGKKSPPPNSFSVKDVDAKYFPAYVTDLAAVRMHLDQKNDAGNLNTSSIYAIAANDAATLALLWTATEWYRPAVHPLLGGGQQYKIVPTQGIAVDPEAGRDIAGIITLSGSRPLNVPSIKEATAQNWVKTTLKLRENNPMLLLYGPDDRKAKDGANFFFDEVLVAKGNKQLSVKPLEQTFLKPLDNAKGLNGVALLGNNDTIKTEDTIIKYMAALQKERVAVVRKNRNYVSPYYIDLRAFGVNP